MDHILLPCFVALACAACGAGGGPASLDGALSMDATAPDAQLVDGALMDAGDLDSSTDASSDAGVSDAGPGDAGAGDAAMDGGADSGVACSVGGVPGECIEVSLCTGGRVATPGHCAGPSTIQCCTSSTATFMCDEAAMPTPNAGLMEESGAAGCREGMLPVGASFCVDRYEASLSLVNADGSLSSWSPFWNPDDRRVRALSLPGAVPQAYINGVQAAAACGEAGKRLCSDAEWLRACQGSAGSTYPYGNVRMDGVCNDARAVHPAVEYFGTGASWIWSMLGNSCIDQLPDSLALSGAHPACVSEDGALDMMGNLHEWTSDPAGTFRGGFYADTVRNGPGCLYRTTAHDTSHWDYSTGFRCCADRSAP